MNQIVRIVFYDTGVQSALPVKIETLTPELQNLFRPFIGKTVTLKGNKIVETEIKQ